MRLLDTSTLALKEFNDVPDYYAILSHTWGQRSQDGEDVEVRFQDLGNPEVLNRTLGYTKVKAAAEQAKRDGYSLIWVDSCCIDSSSSAELTEAINSMFHWYEQASVCYVYLFDVDIPAHVEDWTKGKSYRDAFAHSKWFTRGWTLQELIAASTVNFFSSKWSLLGTKAGMCDFLSTITGIDAYILTGGDLSDISVARRMCWASARETTRPEDVAYCLLGIFNVNMPLLYGEGYRNAFHRLQDAILKVSDDQSLFAWNMGSGRRSTLFADHPHQFQWAKMIGAIPHRRAVRNMAIATNNGLEMRFITIELPPNGIYDKILVLDCQIGPILGVYPAFVVDYSGLIRNPMIEVGFSYPDKDMDQAGVDPSTYQDGTLGSKFQSGIAGINASLDGDQKRRIAVIFESGDHQGHVLQRGIDSFMC